MPKVELTPEEKIAQRHAERDVVPSLLASREWRDKVSPALRLRSFFSARVHSAKVLQSARDYVTDYLSQAREPKHGGLKAQGRTEFVAQMRQLVASEGLGRLDPKTGRINEPIDNTDLQDLRSIARLELIFDTATESANEFAYWQSGNDSDVLDAFPAQRFIRVRPVKVPRPYHAANENAVRRKDDLAFWLDMNRDFEVPWGPWGYNSGMGVEDVSRAEAEELGLIQPGETVRPPDALFNKELAASTRSLDADILAMLKVDLGSRAVLGADGYLRPQPEFLQKDLPLPAAPSPPLPLEEPKTTVKPTPQELLQELGLLDKVDWTVEDLQKIGDRLREINRHDLRAEDYIKHLAKPHFQEMSS